MFRALKICQGPAVGQYLGPVLLISILWFSHAQAVMGLSSTSPALPIFALEKPLTENEKVKLQSRWDLGYYLIEIKAFGAAAAEFEKIHALLPGNSSLLAMIGSCLIMSGKWPSGEKALIEALKLSPEDPDIQILLGQGYVSTGESLKGAGFLEKALEILPDISPDKDELRFQLANIYLEAGKPRLAFGHLELILKNRGTRTFENPEMDFAFAQCLLQFGNDRLAFTFAEKAHQAEVGNSQYARALGLCHFARKEYHAAAKLWALALANGAGDADLYLQLGEAQFLDRHWVEAEQAWWEGCQGFPNSYALLSRLLQFYIEIAKPNLAQDLVHFAEKQNPRHPGNLLLQVQEGRKLSTYAAAWKSLERLKRQACGSLMLGALWEEAQLSFLTGKYAACQKLLDELIRLNSHQSEAHSLMAKLALQLGDSVLAQAHFGEAKKFQRNDLRVASLNLGVSPRAIRDRAAFGKQSRAPSR